MDCYSGFNFQPSEPAKIAVVPVLFARYLSEIPNDRLDHIVSYVPAIVMLAVLFTCIGPTRSWNVTHVVDCWRDCNHFAGLPKGGCLAAFWQS